MLICHGCECHVRVDESNCPFCGAALGTTSAPRPTRIGSMALTAGLTLLGCATDTSPTDTAADGGSTSMMSGEGTAGTTTDAGLETSTDTGVDTSTSTSGDGDGDDWAERGEAAYGLPELPCDELGPEPVVVGANAILVTPGFNELYQTCGGVGTASLYSFTAAADGDYEFAVIDADFSPVISLIGYICSPPEELGCVLPPETITQALLVDEVIYVAVDSDDMQVDGTATLTITPL